MIITDIKKTEFEIGDIVYSTCLSRQNQAYIYYHRKGTIFSKIGNCYDILYDNNIILRLNFVFIRKILLMPNYLKTV